MPENSGRGGGLCMCSCNKYIQEKNILLAWSIYKQQCDAQTLNPVKQEQKNQPIQDPKGLKTDTSPGFF